MEPANTIISKLGGAVIVAQIVGVHRVTPHKWMKSKEHGGTGGVIPFDYIEKLIAHAEIEGIDLKFADFAPKSSAATGGS